MVSFSFTDVWRYAVDLTVSSVISGVDRGGQNIGDDGSKILFSPQDY